jgi:hypothetical protein
VTSGDARTRAQPQTLSLTEGNKNNLCTST